MGKPLAIDLYCGLGGWAEGFLADGWDVIGFDIERHAYGSERYPAQLVLQDVLTLHGSQLSRAAGRHIPLVVENVRGAQPWVGRAKANYGSYYLWGDVEKIGGRIVRAGPVKFGMPAVKAVGRAQKFNPDGTEHPQGSWFKIADSVRSSPSFNGGEHETRGVKQGGSGPEWFDKLLDERRKRGTKCGGEWFGAGSDRSPMRQYNSHSTARKTASAMIAKIPLDLAAHIARCFRPAPGAPIPPSARLDTPVSPE